METDVTGVNLRAGLLQVREEMNYSHDKVPDNVILCQIVFPIKCVLSAEQWYINIKHKALGTLFGLQKLNHYYFVKEIYTVTDHKPLLTIVSKDVATLSQQLQCIMLHIHQYIVYILYKPDPDLYIVDCLS